MPRSSSRVKKLHSLQKALKSGISLRLLFDGSDDESVAEDVDLLNASLIDEYQELLSKRYSFRGSYRKARYSRFVDDLETNENNNGAAPWLTDKEFLQKYRMSHESFLKIVDLIKDNDIFKQKARGRKQVSIQYQLMVLLKYLGTEGSGASNPGLRNTFGIGRGTAEKYRQRVVHALLMLSDRVIIWPDANERRCIAARMQNEFKFPNCVGLMDGTLFPLRTRPEREDAPDYSGRKYQYSLSTLIVCDDQRLIRYYLAGWPGSAHDNRIFRNSRIAQHPDDFFSDLEYLLVDSAFEASPFIIPAFKKPQNLPMPREQEVFNHALGAPRVASEHCIGLLKGRFPWLRSIPCKLTQDVNCMRRTLHYIECCIILHNLLVQHTDHVEPEAWGADLDEFSDIDDPERAEEFGLHNPIPPQANHGHRRQQLCNYVNETHLM